MVNGGGRIYLVGSLGRFGMLNGGSNPANGTWSFFGSNISPFWRSDAEVTATAYLPSNATIYGGGNNGELFGYQVGYTSNKNAISTTVDSVANTIYKATLTATATLPANTTITYYLSNNGGTNWNQVTSGSEYTFSTAASDLRWKANLTTSDLAVTPEITNIAISYKSLTSYTGSINLKHDASREVNFYSLAHSATVPAGSSLAYKVRTASTEGGLTSAAWGTPFSVMPHSLTSETTDNRWIEIQADLTSTEGLATPDIDSITLDYVDNDKPTGQNLSVSYATDGSHTLTINYEAKDSDTLTNPYNAGQVNASFEYSTDNGENWDTFTPAAVSGDKGLVSVNQLSYSAKSALVNLATDLDETYAGSQFKIRLTLNDNELARNSNTYNSSAITIDTKNPTSPAYTIAGGSSETNTVNLSGITAIDDSTLSAMMISKSATFEGADWQSYSTTLDNYSATSGDTIYIKIKDAYGNISAPISHTVPVQVTNVVISDLSDAGSSDYRLAIGWHALSSDPLVAGYKLYRKVDSGSYSELASIGNKNTNGYIDTTVTASHTYSYYLYANDSSSNLGLASAIVSGQPAFVPTISAVTVAATSYDRATITWTTDVNCDSFVEFGTTTAYGAVQGSSDLVTSHQYIATGLNPDTTFHSRVRSRDQKGTLAVSSDSTFVTTSEPASPVDETQAEAKIKNVQTSEIDFDSAIVTWETTVVTKTTLQYGAGGALTNSVEDESSSYTTKHTIKIDNLSTGATYQFRVVGEDMLANKYASDNYTFQTLSLPVISSLQVSSINSYGATISWKTNTPTSSTVVYGNEGSSLDQVQGTDSALSTDHSVVLTKLLPASKYSIKAKSTDSSGNTVYSDVASFSTTIDVSPPEISDLRSETSILSDETGQSRVQAIISWTTNEPATSQVKYNEGIAAQSSYSQSTQEDQSLTTSHVVIISSLKPATTYHATVVSKDSSGNIGVSKDYSFLSEKPRQTILQFIIQIWEESFAWVKKIGLFQ
jgi:hypothetical protein